MKTMNKIAATGNLVYELANATVKIAIVGVVVYIGYNLMNAEPEAKPHQVKEIATTYDKVKEARHQCINMVRGSRKLGSGEMIGGTANYRFTNKHPSFGEQRVICGINGSDYQLETVRVASISIYKRAH